MPLAVLAVATVDQLAVLVCGVPDLSSIEAAALATDNLGRVDVHAAVPIFQPLAAFALQLGGLESPLAHNRLVVILHVVLWHLSSVFHLFLGQEILCEALLQERIAFVLLVAEHIRHRARVPSVLPAWCLDALLHQPVSYGIRRESGQVERKDVPDHLCLLFVDDKLTVLASVVAKEMREGNADLAVSKPLPLSPLAVLGNGAALLLRKTRHDGD